MREFRIVKQRSQKGRVLSSLAQLKGEDPCKVLQALQWSYNSLKQVELIVDDLLYLIEDVLRSFYFFFK